MKQLLCLCCLLLVLQTLSAQIPPQAFNYSAVARNPQGNPIANSTISIQISILKGSISGNVQYVENHNVSTDAFGLFNLAIGMGAVQQGSMSAINWGTDNYFLQVGMDASGGSNFTTMGTTQLLSVPYALHAGTANSLSSLSGSQHYIGQAFGGGVIFHLYRDSMGVEHGLIVAINDQSLNMPWDSSAACLAGNCINVHFCESTWNGRANTDRMLAELTNGPSAASICAAYNGGGFTDWYLPAIQEQNLLWNNLYAVNKTLSSINGASEILHNIYWSSTEVDLIGAWLYGFLTGNVAYFDKVTYYHVRAIRAF